MGLIKYQNQFPSLIDNFFDNDFRTLNFSRGNTTLPSVNVKENPDSFVVEVAAPGFIKSDFNIELNNNVLTIWSDKKTEQNQKEDERYSTQEFIYESFKRSFNLPDLVDQESILANYENGILAIIIPKLEEAKPKPIKQIEIR